jgi:ACR3 family arsenite transporter
MSKTAITTSTWQIAKSVLIFLGIPLVAGYLTRRNGESERQAAVRVHFPAQDRTLGPVCRLLFTIVILFALHHGLRRHMPLFPGVAGQRVGAWLAGRCGMLP